MEAFDTTTEMVVAWILFVAVAAASLEIAIAEEEAEEMCLPNYVMQCPATPAPAYSQHVCAINPPLPPPVLRYTNPLLFHNSTIFPPFDAIHALHIVPGIRTLLHQLVLLPYLCHTPYN